MRLIFIFTCLLLATSTLKAQDREGYSYSREFIWGISKNTNSGLIAGMAIKFSRSVRKDHFQTFGLEIVNVKHPKEARYHSFSGNTFIWGKENYLFSIRPQYGREWVLFKKAPQQGVQINAILAGGPTLGLLTPYYVRVEGNGASQNQLIPFDPDEVTFTNILGSGPFLKGLGESEVLFGLNVKASLSFEFGTFKSDVTGFEAGFQVEAFPKEVIIVPAAENRAIFPSAFIMLFYGKRR
jgi:hypothetical protein